MPDTASEDQLAELCQNPPAESMPIEYVFKQKRQWADRKDQRIAFSAPYMVDIPDSDFRLLHAKLKENSLSTYT